MEEFTGFAPETLEDQSTAEDEPGEPEDESEGREEPEPEDWGEFEHGELELPEEEQVIEEEEEIPPEMQIGSILRPTAGPSYIVETDAESLRETPLVMAALVALIDMEQHG